jgi:acetyl-CoA C-acetyltransferase/acetyl-CoA acyltransferase
VSPARQARGTRAGAAAARRDAGAPGRREAVVVGGVRTPFGRAGGVLEPLSAPDLGRIVMVEALARTGVAGEDLDHVVMGCGGQPADAGNPARVAALRGGVPARVPAYTVQRNCAAGMEAIAQAALMIETGRADVVLCGGMESMSSYPVQMPRSYRRKLGRLAAARSAGARAVALARFRLGDLKPEIGLKLGLTDPTCGLSMGETAEVLARELGIGRAEQDEYALRSHRLAAAARARLAEEIVPVAVPETGAVLAQDDAVREQQTLEALGKLKPAFARSHGTVTAGNSCGITDGACALVVAERGWAARRWPDGAPLARIVSWAAVGLDPERMGLGPAGALPAALGRAGWSLAEVDLLEINEAFAVQVLAVLRVAGDAELSRHYFDLEEATGSIDLARLNVNGGAIALGHPVGVSGARLTLTLALEMKRRGVPRGAASLCVGGGQGMAILLEACGV